MPAADRRKDHIVRDPQIEGDTIRREQPIGRADADIWSAAQ
jgi:hypothetical protein